MADLLGYAASCAVLATFLMRTMVPLRLVAILSNVLFLVFGYLQNIHPVFVLHLALLPINFWRLFAPQLETAAESPTGAGPSGSPVASRPYTLWFVFGVLAGVAISLGLMFIANPQHV